jgi:hypothetical protein
MRRMPPTSIEGFIYSDEGVKRAQAWRYNPERGTVILPEQNVLNEPNLHEFRGANHER